MNDPMRKVNVYEQNPYKAQISRIKKILNKNK